MSDCLPVIEVVDLFVHMESGLSTFAFTDKERSNSILNSSAMFVMLSRP